MNSSLLDFALAIGVAINVIKGADFLLLPHQQQWIQNLAETATLRLDDLRPMELLRLLATSRAHKMIFASALLANTTVSGYESYCNYNKHLYFNAFSGLGGLILSAAFVSYYIRYGPRLVRWLIGEGRVEQFLLRLPWFGCSGCLCLPFYFVVALFTIHRFLGHGVAVTSFLDQLVQKHYDSPAIALYFCLALFIPPFTYFSIILSAGVFTLYFVITVAIVEAILKLVRAFAWRVVEYDKGACAALIFVATVVLGILKFFVRI